VGTLRIGYTVILLAMVYRGIELNLTLIKMCSAKRVQNKNIGVFAPAML